MAEPRAVGPYDDRAVKRSLVLYARRSVDDRRRASPRDGLDCFLALSNLLWVDWFPADIVCRDRAFGCNDKFSLLRRTLDKREKLRETSRERIAIVRSRLDASRYKLFGHEPRFRFFLFPIKEDSVSQISLKEEF